jgi:hypothetical protein
MPLKEQLREKVDLTDEYQRARRGSICHRLSSPGVTNHRDIPFEVIRSVIVECLGAPEKRFRFPPGAQPEHLLDLRRRDRPGALRLNSIHMKTWTR